jgi:hypothetical protein
VSAPRVQPSTEAAYGLDTTRFQNIFRINNRYYEIVRLLYRDVRGSLSLRGRSTQNLPVYIPCKLYTVGRLLYTVFRVCTLVDSECRTSPIYCIPESRMPTLSGVDHLSNKLTYKKMYQINGHIRDGRYFPTFMVNLPLQMPSATTTVGLKIPMVPRGAFE